MVARCSSEMLRLHVLAQGLVIVDDLHAAPAQHVARAHHDGIADLVRDVERVLDGDGHARFGHGDAQAVHDLAEAVAVLGQVDDLGARAEDVDSGCLELACEVERRLAAELRDDADRLLLLVDGEHVLGGERLEVELVGGVVVGRDRLGVAVDDDRREAELLERERRVHAAVVELDALADAVGAAAQDHDLLAGGRLALVGRVIG